MLVYLTCSSLFISRIKCPNTFYPAARGVNREDLWRFWKFPSSWNTTASPLHAAGRCKRYLTDKDALTGYSGHILLFLFLSHIYIPTMAFKPWTFSPRWSHHPPPQRPNPVFVSGCKNFYFCCNVYCRVYGDRLTAGTAASAAVCPVLWWC